MGAPFPPIEPPPTGVRFPDPREEGAPDVLAVGADFSPGTLLSAYRRGIFPWPQGDADRKKRPLVLWFSPDPRAIFPLDRPMPWSRSLRRRLRTHPWEVTLDTAFRDVVEACAEARRGHTWIIPALVDGYVRLHELGWAHSVEVWERDAAGGRSLVGGIYGVAIGGLFAGESMFHARTDASKVAFASLAERLVASGFALFDVQVQNDHLESLGCVEVDRARFLAAAARATALPRRLR